MAGTGDTVSVDVFIGVAVDVVGSMMVVNENGLVIVVVVDDGDIELDVED